MINELHNLAKTMERIGISSNEWHREYKTIPKVTEKSPCIRIWLDCNGSICDLECLNEDLASKLRKYGNNQNSFPAFNISPLYRLTDLESIHELERIEDGQSELDIERIRSWSKEDNWIKGAPGQIQRNLEDCPARLLEAIGAQTQSKSNIITELISLCEKLRKNIGGGFRASLENCIFEKLQSRASSEDIRLGLALMFHKGSAEKEHSKDVGKKLSVILDVWDWQQYGYPVASEQTTSLLNEMLLANSVDVEIPADNSQFDAFGSPFLNPNKPMPSVKLSGFEVTLRSMFSGQPCQYRYNQIGDGSYPIAIENRSSIKKSLEWIAAPSRRQVTWEKIDKDEIVFVYPSKLPEISPKFASIFSNDFKRTEDRFEKIARELAESFRGIPADQNPDNLQIFTIQKLDKARSKLLFTHNTTPEQLMQATNDWSIGCRNIPELEINKLIIPFPLEVEASVNSVWKTNGERADRKIPVKRMKYYQGVQLLLDILPHGAIYNFLHIILENSSGLINYLGNLLYRGRKIGSNAELRRLETQKNMAAQIISVLGLLLYKCGIRKENYMEELSYLLGQLLHVSDELHTLYCKIKRNGDIPPQLAGSALFTTAGEMPYQALSQLSTRLNSYISWAKQYQYKDIATKGEESWRARWLLGLFEQLSNKVHLQMDKSIRFSDYEKAQLFIGYMASLPKKDATEQNKIMGGNKNE